MTPTVAETDAALARLVAKRANARANITLNEDMIIGLEAVILACDNEIDTLLAQRELLRPVNGSWKVNDA
jgi:hypothetical protein